MRLFVYEYTCGSSLADYPDLASLRTEGRAMLSAVLEDAARLPALESVTLLDRSCVLASVPGPVRIRWLDGIEERIFREEALAADWTWVIAPESEGILASRCAWVESAGGHTLNCSLPAIALTGDKLALAELWQSQGLATPATRAWPAELSPEWFPLVWKPRFGAGSQATFLLCDPSDLQRVEQLAEAEGYQGPAIVTRHAPGQPASIAWLVGPNLQVPLPPAHQLLSQDGRFHYLGGELPLPPALAERAMRLSRAALNAVPGLHGYVGVDLVLGNAADGSADQVIEINPRLTTSYLGLRRLARFNLLQALLDVVQGKPVDLQWNLGPVRFLVHPEHPESS